MPNRRQLLYYQLLKYSGEDSLCGNVLDRAVDDLCNAPSLQLAGASAQTHFDGLVQTAKDFGVLSILEVTQWCSELEWHLSCGRDECEAEFVPVLLARALEVAGVAFAISSYSSQRFALAEGSLCSTSGMKHLLLHQGDQVVQDVAARVDAFTLRFVSNTLALHARLQSLSALKRAHEGAYQILSRHKAFRAVYEACGPRRSASTVFAEVQSDMLKASPKHQPSGRTAFQVEVVAGMDCLDFSALEVVH